MSSYTRSVPEDEDEGVSPLVKLDMALAARDVYGASGDGPGPHPLPRLSEQLLVAAHARSAAPFAGVLDQMVQGHISPEMIIDVYLPETARLLGEAWGADTLRFTDVTIAAGRIQSALHRFDPIWQDHDPAGPRPACLVVSRQNAQHTLGPTLLASQMRRRGISVELALGVSPADLRSLVTKKHYNAVFISATGCDDIEALRELVRHVRQTKSSAPVVIGGSFFDEFPADRYKTGADFVTSDLNEALRHCRILLPYSYEPNSAFATRSGDADSRAL